jgi:hypothetical protein
MKRGLLIKKDQVIPLILEACPSFQGSWDKIDDKDSLYPVMGELSRHLLSLYLEKRTDEFGPLCEVVERLHVDGDGEVRELATFGFLDGVRNVWGHAAADPEGFYGFLLPESRKRWKELDDSRSGELPSVGAGLGDKRSKRTPRTTKIKISVGIVAAFLVSIWMGITSGPITGIAYFFILTVLLWAMAKARRWI